MADEPKLLFAFLEDRGLLRVAGPDARPFLQGIVSNDIEKVAPSRAIWAALLTPQGKYLHDFFVMQHGAALLLDAEAARRDDLMRRLLRFKLRSNVSIAAEDPGLGVAAIWGDGAAAACGLNDAPGSADPHYAAGCVFVDPRLKDAGIRVVAPREAISFLAARLGAGQADAKAYDAHRLALGLPDGSRDLEIEKSILLENGFNELNGVDWDKGCYMGQELTARTHYRALIKKRLMPVAIDGPMPAADTPITVDGAEIGTMRSARDGRGLALLRLDALDKAPFFAGAAKLTPQKPDWMKL
ncbi:MAG: folate-binding protein YgfZ [Alphaproteobacteria bacterium]